MVFYQDLIQFNVLGLGEQVSGILLGPHTVQCVRTERTGYRSDMVNSK